MKKLSLIIFGLTLSVFTVVRAQSYLSGDIGGMTLTADTEWIVLDSVWVEDGDSLAIEPGTTVKFTPGIDAYLIVKRGGYIHAQGTASDPIIFTSAAENPQPRDWKTVGFFGKSTGQNPDWTVDSTHNTGILQYIIMEYSNWSFGLYNIGSGTTVDHISAIYGGGFYILGGNVNLSYLSVNAASGNGMWIRGGYTGNIDEVLINGAVRAIDIGNLNNTSWETQSQTDPDALPRTNPTITHLTMTNIRELPIRFRFGGVGTISQSILYEYSWNWTGIRCYDDYLLSDISIDSIQHFEGHRPLAGNSNAEQVLTNVIEDDPMFEGFVPTNSGNRGAMTGGDWLSSWGRFVPLDKVALVYLTWIGTVLPGDTVFTDLHFGLSEGNDISSADVEIVYDPVLFDVWNVIRNLGFYSDAEVSVVSNVMDDTIYISLTSNAPLDPDVNWDAVRIYFITKEAYDDTSVFITPVSVLVNEDNEDYDLWTHNGYTRADVPHILLGDVSQNDDITSYDASLILQNLVGYFYLNNVQEYVANVSGNEGVTAYDASLIQQYMVNLIDLFPADTGGYSAPGFGDLSMNNAEIEAGQQIDIPLYLSNGENIMSFEWLITFNQEHLSYDEIIWSDLLNDFTIEVNAENGEIRVAAAGPVPDGHEGVFATLRFTVDPNFNEGETTVSLMNLRWNEEEIMTNVATATLTNVLGIGNSNKNIPTQFGLSQNYPNPFNPLTTISFQLPRSVFINLSIYNLAGQLVKTLVNEHKNAGYHSVVWDASSVSSGIYLYRIEAGEFSKVRKCLVVK